MRPRNIGRALGVICGALIALLLGQVLSRLASGYGETAVATVYRPETRYLTGTVLRQEQTVTLPETGDFTPARSSGERVGAGQTLFYTEKDPRSAELARTVRMLRRGKSMEQTPLLTRRNLLRETIRQLNGGTCAVRRTQAETLGGLCRAELPEEALQEALTAAEGRLLETAEAGGDSLTAPVSGIFSGSWDGLEEDPDGTLPPSERRSRTAGRLVTGDTWYFSTLLPDAMEEGDTVTLELFCGIFAPVTFRVESGKETPEGFACRLSCRSHLSEVSELRTLTAAFPAGEAGLEIPARAVYTVEGETGVWCLVGDSPRFKPVTVTENLTDTVVVALDRSSTENLLPGDVVLLDGWE